MGASASHFASEPVDCSTSGTRDLDMSLMFDLDDALRAYAESDGRDAERGGRIDIAQR
ncbi:hypothetical protein [Streptomyces sp. NPDC001930]|uniref:hypothetical protein n=1 Tax=Streptomyces sp. NPDC001930 TaxID=3364625 RepID=UPI0036C8581D